MKQDLAAALAKDKRSHTEENRTPSGSQGGLPPLLDRELFFGDPEISQAALSPDGKLIGFLKPLHNVRNIWVKTIDEPMSAARPLTADRRRPIPGFFWTRDSRFILFGQDVDGDENYNIYAVDPLAANAPDREVPAARNLTNATNAQARFYSLPKSDPDLIYVGLNSRAPAWHDVYRIRISDGERTLIRENDANIRDWAFDNRGQLRLATRTVDNGDTELLRIDGTAFTRIGGCSALETYEPIRFHPDGQRVYLLTNVGRDVDLTRLVLLDPKDGESASGDAAQRDTTSHDTASRDAAPVVATDPLQRADLADLLFSERTDDLVGAVYQDDRMRIEWIDESFAADYKHLQDRLPGKDIHLTSMTADDRMWLIAASSDVEPGQCLLFNRATKDLVFQYQLYDKVPRDYLAPMTAIRYPSSDGLMITAFLTLPIGVPSRALPLVVVPHGGPWSQCTRGYHQFTQLMANRGYAVLEPNFRGSTGAGKTFLNAGNGEWGEKMQDDITWGVRHLVEQGIVDPKRVAIQGGSYGGYASLAGAAFTPDLYAAAVSVVGPSNLITLLETIPPYWESVRKVFYVRIADLGTPEGRARLARQSPLNAADRITTPLLIMQGANDPRVKKAESEQIVVALRERGFPVEYLLVPNEGHGFHHPINNLARILATERFFARYLGGRCQETASPEVAQRLAEITVDVKTVAVATRAASR